MRNIARKTITTLPNLHIPLDESKLPNFTWEDYENRLNALYDLGRGKYTHYVLYGDREHFSNIEYFTGIDPRFEECLLILSEGQTPTIVVGDEGHCYAARIPYPIHIAIYHAFSLPQQPRDFLVTLPQILREAGLDEHSEVGVVGWKWFDSKDYDSQEERFDLPVFVYNELLKVCDQTKLHNAVDLLIDNNFGLRSNLDEKELILCEVAGTKSSRATLRVLQNLREGITELEASAFLQIDGAPLNAHPNVNFGENYFYALASPSHDGRLKRGDIVGAGMAYRRSLCHKVAFYVADESELKPEMAAEIRQLYDTYFAAVTAWYQALSIGVTGGEVHDRVCQVTGPLLDFGIGLNPGHTIHTEEWLNTPFYSDSKDALHSGMAIQCDFTASLPDKGMAVHAEDGVILADENMRQRIKAVSPESYARMQARREFMINVLGINLADEVLPTSDLPGVVFPYLADLSTVLANH